MYAYILAKPKPRKAGSIMDGASYSKIFKVFQCDTHWEHQVPNMGIVTVIQLSTQLGIIRNIGEKWWAVVHDRRVKSQALYLIIVDNGWS